MDLRTGGLVDFNRAQIDVYFRFNNGLVERQSADSQLFIETIGPFYLLNVFYILVSFVTCHSAMNFSPGLFGLVSNRSNLVIS